MNQGNELTLLRHIIIPPVLKESINWARHTTMRTMAFLLSDAWGERIWRSSSTGVSLLLDIVMRYVDAWKRKRIRHESYILLLGGSRMINARGYREWNQCGLPWKQRNLDADLSVVVPPAPLILNPNCNVCWRLSEGIQIPDVNRHGGSRKAAVGIEDLWSCALNH